ncbi:MAG TPA: acyl-CoA dehydrogenase family protein [Roseiarcus sp.]|nr:acyl-CoA dehydrogenase family protein [Roseiarcus sp.]
MLLLSEEQRLLQESARSAVAAEAPVSLWRKLRASRDEAGYSREFWRACAQMGWAGILIPQTYGGLEFGLVGAGLVAREMARTLAASPFLSSAVMAARALAEGGSDAQKRQWLPKIAAGEAIVSVAVDEQARHQPYDLASVAAASAKGWRLAGEKICVLDGGSADAFLVAAGSGQERNLYLVEAATPGVSRSARTLVDDRRVATMRFEVELPAEARLGGGAALIDAVLDAARGVLSASLCGVAEQAFDSTISYLKQRRQFDRAIGSFQALQHRAAVMHVAIENAWSATLKALQALEAGADDAPLQIAMAKAKASQTGRETAAECLQLHGGIGMTDEFDIGLYLKKARVEAELFGDPSFHGDRVAAMLGY